MSWDIWVEMDCGGDEPMCSEGFNCTYNVAPMFNKAFATLDGGLRSLDKMPCWTAEAELALAIDYMKRNKAEMEKLNPPNGWGSYDSAVKTLEKCLTLCKAYPKAQVRID